MKRLFLSLLALWLLAAPSAFASVTYHFEFSRLAGVTLGSGNDFSLDLVYDDFVTTTGMAKLSGPALPTTLGYSVAFAGTNNNGEWGFDDGASAIIGDNRFFRFSGLSFLFNPLLSHYITEPGVLTGTVEGNAPFEFFGSAVLTVVPEPGLFPLAALGLVALWRNRRKQA